MNKDLLVMDLVGNKSLKDTEISVKPDKMALNSNQTMNMTNNLESTPLSFMRDNINNMKIDDGFEDSREKEKDLTSNFQIAGGKKVNIVVLGPTTKYTIYPHANANGVKGNNTKD